LVYRVILSLFLIISWACSKSDSGDSGADSPNLSSPGPNEGENPDSLPSDDDGNNQGNPPPPSDLVTITGSIGTLAFDSLGGNNSDLAVAAYNVKADGSLGSLLQSAPVGDNGSFQLEIPPLAGQLQIAVQPDGMALTDSFGLTATPDTFRLHLASASADRTVAINEITELATRRMYQRLQANPNDLELARKAGYAEAAALTGVNDVSKPPQDLSVPASTDRSGFRYQLFLYAIAKRKTDLDISSDEMISAFLLDAEDGALNGKSDQDSIRIDGKTIFRQSNLAENELRDLMKDVIKDADETIAANFNDIPKVSSNMKINIDLQISNDTLDSFQPDAPTPFEHWIEFRYGPSFTLDFAHDDNCLGPVWLARVNEKGRLVNEGPELQAGVGADHWEVHDSTDCTSQPANITIPEDTGTSAPFYLKHTQYTYNTISAIVPSNLVPKVDYGFLYLQPTYNGKLISNMLYPDVFSNLDGPIRDWQGIGQAGTELNRDQCYSGAVILTCGGSLCNQGGVFPNNLNLTMAVGNLGLAGAGTVTLYSDSACMNSLVAGSLVLPGGQEHVPFYLKASANFSRGGNPDWSLIWILVNGLYVQSFQSGNIYVKKN
jgi:hypothetical protein